MVGQGSRVISSLAIVVLMLTQCAAQIPATVDRDPETLQYMISKGKAVLRALDWLARHQRSDGSWAPSDYHPQCKDPASPCKSAVRSYTDGQGFKGYAAGVTGLAVLAFVRAGQTHQKGKHQDVVLNAMNWILERQAEGDPEATGVDIDGRLGGTACEEWTYNHAIATQAIGALLLKSKDKATLGSPVQRAIAFTMRIRNPGYGWKYEMKDGKNDTSVTTWMLESIAVAQECAKKRLIATPSEELEKAAQGALNWIDRATSTKTGVTGYQSPGDEGSRLVGVYPEPYPYSKRVSCMTAAGLNCRALASTKKDPAIPPALAVLAKEIPKWQPAGGKRRSKVNMYYWYHGTKALSTLKSKPWKQWKGAVKQVLITNQRESGCELGSWDPIGEWGASGGRVYATAIGALTLGYAK